MTYYTTLQDVIDQVVKPAVGPDADLYDLWGIALSVATYRYERDELGRFTGGRGFQLLPEYDYDNPDEYDRESWKYVLKVYKQETNEPWYDERYVEA